MTPLAEQLLVVHCSAVLDLVDVGVAWNLGLLIGSEAVLVTGFAEDML